ncbi:uncharacterized protein STAUR_3009 [Stigmatella aurantiaca DW4/3-1]|uniref:Uncharacterized protein n=1 Tax=Stigmatella aurantiaca (strain DW4/3-1) TaxID=378806 RepID=E3FS78_STIAD|nr:uncharacterized protein STAUR_3009 [Stigmatella aurantiaca DW4/3-1]
MDPRLDGAPRASWGPHGVQGATKGPGAAQAMTAADARRPPRPGQRAGPFPPGRLEMFRCLILQE